jgi:hypothetical protein
MHYVQIKDKTVIRAMAELRESNRREDTMRDAKKACSLKTWIYRAGIAVLGWTFVSVVLLRLVAQHQEVLESPQPDGVPELLQVRHLDNPTDVISNSINSVSDFPKEPNPRPPLDSIVQGWNVTGDPTWLLNVAVVGFPKCGTSTLMYHLESHPEVQFFTHERCEMTGNQHVPLMRSLYNDLPPGDYVRGIKCPRDMELSIPAYQKYFKKASFIVGIRHPVLWFESFYNFRVHNGQPMKPAEECRGMHIRGCQAVSTFRANFHLFLSRLGKTNIYDPEELKYIARKERKHLKTNSANFTQKVFLFEVTQLNDKDETRSLALREDLQKFLHLKEPIPPFIHFRPGKAHSSEKLKSVTKSKINICDDRYNELRTELMGLSMNTARWIRKYFVQSKDVVVSSKDHFTNSIMMESWERDPCLDRPVKVVES